jgi:hypothetical protein
MRVMSRLENFAEIYVLLISEFLDVKTLTSLAATSKAIRLSMEDFIFGPLWKTRLHDEVDENRAYHDTIPKEMRERMEKHFGVRRVISSLRSPLCVACGKYTPDFNVITCSRACIRCWMGLNVGSKGLDTDDSPFALCARGFAKTHYLCSDKEMDSLFGLKVDDEVKSHGFMSPKVEVYAIAAVKALSDKRCK